MDGGTEIATTLHRFSVGDYHRMGEAGLLDDMRVELIRGTIVDMAPIGTPHVLTVMRLTQSFAPLLVDLATVALPDFTVAVADILPPVG